ncbi:MAG: queuine/other tRNA-ribosyltransferase [Theionarchaea archaeon]|nr:queuine/other tRNA-ribosyltransferase [Theionarchaea archaeon]
MKFYLPDWEDRLDPDFDFANDEYSEGHKENPYTYDMYAHQLFDTPLCDGILVSLSIFRSKISLNKEETSYSIRDCRNIKDFLRIPGDSTLRVMGDCGAFGYVKEIEPPKPFYSVENVVNLYEKLGFDFGVSVDHLVVDYVLTKNIRNGKREKRVMSIDEKRKRIQLTLKNAEEFLRLHKKEKCDFIPVGVAQGYDQDTYRRSVRNLTRMGYEYIGMGGLVQYSSEFILHVLRSINSLIKGKDVHLFGTVRPDYLRDFESLGATSFDSASFLRKAWLRDGQNYLAPNGKWYSAIRVPQSSNSRLMRTARLNDFSLDDLRRMELDSLEALIDYDQTESDLDHVLDVVLRYDGLLLRSTKHGNLRKNYRKTLLDMPWKHCKCDICRKIGIHVIIFRGSNRNKRRGFHNIWILNRLKNDI